ncbi:MAG: hypothetical protein AAFP26_14210 [Planctomycetota bacterium]
MDPFGGREDDEDYDLSELRPARIRIPPTTDDTPLRGRRIATFRDYASRNNGDDGRAQPANPRDFGVDVIKQAVAGLVSGLLEQAAESGLRVYDRDDACRHATERTLVLRLWRDGFTIDDAGAGELFVYHSADNISALDRLVRGQIPPGAVGKDEVVVEDRREQDHVPGRMIAFSGRGRSLNDDNPPRSTPQAQPPPPIIVVDETKPITRLQIRLTDGTRLTRSFNRCHLVADLRRVLPTAADDDVDLMTSYPPRRIDDDAQTLEEAGLVDAVVVLRRRAPPSVPAAAADSERHDYFI